MTIDRRRFLQTSAAAAGVGLAANTGVLHAAQNQPSSGPFAHLKPMTGGVVRINAEDRKARLDKARRLMAENKIDAIVLDSGTSLMYFTGISWWASERTFVAILPARGDVAYVCPKFEEGRARELITIGSDVRTAASPASASRSTCASSSPTACARPRRPSTSSAPTRSRSAAG
jgi:Xaa-Pro dipeptidase